MNVSEAIRTKRTTREFEEKPVPEDAARSILNAGRRAQSAMNKQPWQFVAVTDRALLGQLADVSGHAGHLRKAGLGVFILMPDESKWSLFDAGQAAAYMQLAAWELGIGSGLGGFTDPSKAQSLLGYPPDLKLIISIAFGYPAASRPPKAGGRKPLEEVVHWNRW